MTKKDPTTVVVVAFNKRQMELLKGLDPVYGDDLPARVQSIVMMFFHDNALMLKGLEE